MLLLSENNVLQLLQNLNQNECMEIIRSFSSALADFSTQSASFRPERTIYQPLRSYITTKDNNRSLFMPVSNTTNTGIKIITRSGRTGSLTGVINVFTPEGQLTGLLSAAEVTGFRTSVATLSLLSRCCNIPKRHICVFGAGKQAEWHTRLILLLYPSVVETVTFINRASGRLQRLLADLQPVLSSVNIKFLVKDGNAEFEPQLRSRLAESDIIFCCTPSTSPLFPHEYLSGTQPAKSRFISLIGSHKPSMQEIDAHTLLSGGGDIYVDSKTACLAEAGELIMAKVNEQQLVEIGKLFASNQKIISSEVGQNVVFKCVGMGLMDLVVAKTLLDMAAERGLGTIVDDF